MTRITRHTKLRLNKYKLMKKINLSELKQDNL